MHSIESTSLSSRDAYSLMTNLIVPRPIAWITTRNIDGTTNLAPYSYFNGLCSDPPMVTVSIVDKKGGADDVCEKDTLLNLRREKRFCINLAEAKDKDDVNQSAQDYATNESEVVAIGRTLKDEAGESKLWLSGARAHLDCEVIDIHRYGADLGVHLVVAQIMSFHFEEAIKHDAKQQVDCQKIDILGRLGSGYYASSATIER